MSLKIMAWASGQPCLVGHWEQGRKEWCRRCKCEPGCDAWATTLEFLLYPHSFISFSNPLPDVPYLWPSKASSAPILGTLERVCASHSLSRVDLLAVSLMIFLASLFFTPAYSWCRVTFLSAFYDYFPYSVLFVFSQVLAFITSTQEL